MAIDRTYVPRARIRGERLVLASVVPIEASGHRAIPVELPAADDLAGLDEYTDAIIEAARDHDNVVLVAQSFGSFGALAAAHLDAIALVLVDTMIPRPGETAARVVEEHRAGTGPVEAAIRSGRSRSSTSSRTSFTTSRSPSWKRRSGSASRTNPRLPSPNGGPEPRSPTSRRVS